jgi:predicted esterase
MDIDESRNPTLPPARTVYGGGARGEVDRAGVLLHGRGGAPENMIDLVARIGLEGTRWVAPAAPRGTWYPQRFIAPLGMNEPYLTHAIAQCDRSLDDASEQGRLASSRLVVVGFSQGACLATEYALRHPGRCGALVVFTGGLVEGLRVLLTGSDVDEWVPDARVRETATVLTDLGADVRLRMYTGRAHIVSDEEVAEAREFLGHLP